MCHRDKEICVFELCRTVSPRALKAEDAIGADLAERTGYPDWIDVSKVKMLILEHDMAAYRLGFLKMLDTILAFKL